MIEMPCARQPPDDLEQPLRLAGGERGRRLVEDDEPRLPGQRLGDLDELALALRQPHYWRDRRHLEVDELQRLPRLVSQLAAIDERQPVQPPREMVEKDVFLDAEIREKAELLMDEGDAERERVARTRRRNLFSGELHSAAVLRQDAAQNVHRRRFSRAVLAYQSENGAAAEFEVQRRAAPGRRKSSC